jgi:replicative DNA helicase
MVLDEDLIKHLKLLPAVQVHDEAISMIQKYKDGIIKPINTGFPLLDKHLAGGFNGGDTVVIGARPGTGKSALSTFFCKNILGNQNGVEVIALYFNFEMSAVQQMLRLFSTQIHATMSQFRNSDGGISEEMLEKLKYFKTLLSFTDLYFVDEATTIDGMYHKIETITTKFPGKQLVCLYDHTRLFSYTSEKTEEEMIRRFSVMANYTCKYYNVLNIVLSQLNRKFEDDTKIRFREPNKSDLFGADALGQCAQITIFPYIPKNFGMTTVDFYIGAQKITMSSEDIMILLLEKNRHGSADKRIPIKHWLQYNLFKEIDAEYYTQLTGKNIYG